MHFQASWGCTRRLLVATQDTVGSLIWGPVLGNSVQYMELVNYHTATWKHRVVSETSVFLKISVTVATSK